VFKDEDMALIASVVSLVWTFISSKHWKVSLNNDANRSEYFLNSSVAFSSFSYIFEGQIYESNEDKVLTESLPNVLYSLRLTNYLSRRDNGCEAFFHVKSAK